MTATTDDPEASPNQPVAAVDYTQHFGQEGHARKLASLRVLLSAFTGVPGIIGLHGGLPPADAFPFTEMSFTLRDGTKMQITDPTQVTDLIHRSLLIAGRYCGTGIPSYQPRPCLAGCCSTAVQRHPARVPCSV